MSTSARLAAFVAAALAVFGVAILVGRAVGPVGEEPPTHTTHGEDPAPDEHAGGHEENPSAEPDATAEVPGGLMSTQDGYTFALADDRVRAGSAQQVTFTITGPDGEPVTSYDVEHEKRLHLIAVRRDFSGFQHVHPTLEDGVWSTDLALTPGSWRLFADFKATGADPLTLGADLAVAGDFRPAPPVGDARTATVDGYTVTLDGDLSAGSDAKLTLSVTKDGTPVTDLQPYLGAYGHLVALRAGDLAYLHVHPDGSPGDGVTEPGPEVVFYAAVPSPGTYHLYLDFQHDGVVRTAAFTVSAGGAGKGEDDEKHEESSGHAH